MTAPAWIVKLPGGNVGDCLVQEPFLLELAERPVHEERLVDRVDARRCATTTGADGLRAHAGVRCLAL